MSLIAIPAAFADSSPRCDTVYFTGATQQSAPNTPFIGELTMTNLLSGQSESADVVTMLLGNVSTDGGQAVTSHEINGGEEPGVHVVTFDEAQLIPQGDGVFTLISHMRIEAGKGRYNCGELVIGADPFAPANNATVTFDQQGIGTAEYAGFGRLCRCKPADN
jgi:hypothetical protein